MKRILLTVLLLLPVEARALNIDNLLSVIAMPLAVAAISQVRGVPTNELSNFIATLNNANVPPPQIIEVLRYVPVALVTDATQQQPVFVDYLQTQVQQGVTGAALIPIIVARLRTFYLQPEVITVSVPSPMIPVQTIVVDQTYVPPVVQTRVDQILTQGRTVQTGAQIVPRENNDRRLQQPVVVQQPPVVQQPLRKDREGRDGGMPPGLARKVIAPPMISGAPPQAQPPGQAGRERGDQGAGKKKEGGDKKDGGDKQHGHGQEGQGHGH